MGLSNTQNTEFGIFPKQWSIKTIQSLIDDSSITSHLDGNHGELYPRADEFKEDGVPYITANDLTGPRVDFSHCKYLAPKRASTFKKGIAKNGDVLFAHNATVGPTGLLTTDLEYVILSTTATYYRCNPEKLNNKFLLHLLQSPMFVRQYRSVMAQSTRFQVPITTQRKLSVFLPESKVEQEAIANTLSDADTYIESLEKLIAKKRLIKKGVMKELLDKSLQNSEVVNLNSLCWFQEGPGVRTHQFTESGVKLLNGTNIKKGQLDLDTTIRFISKSEAYGPYQHFLADEGDIVIASSGITVEKFHEKVAIVKTSDLPLCMNTSTIRFKPKSELLDRDFLFQYLMSDDFKTQIGGQATGSAQLNFGPFHLNRIKIIKPSLEYQKNVAQILNDFDLDLETLKQKLQKALLLKQGMMQELLTGRIRLV